MDEQSTETDNSENVEEAVDSQQGQAVDPTQDPAYLEYWQAKVTDLEAKNKKLYARVAKPAPLQTNATPPDDRLNDLELKLELKDRGIPLEAMPFIKKNGGLKGLEDPLVKTAVETYTTQLKAEQAVEGDSSPRSEIEKKYTLEQMKSMPIEELEKLLR